MLILLALYGYAASMLGVSPIITPLGFVAFSITASLVDSYAVSLIRWLLLGTPSIRTSVYAVF